MQKKLIALAIAGLASSAAFAQSNVTIYGIVDAFYAHGSGDNAAGNSVKFGGIQSGGLAGSRLGFKGEEALGGGLKAVYTLEYMLTVDENVSLSGGSQSGTTARQQFVGLANDSWGSLTLGRQYLPGYFASARNDGAMGTLFSPQANFAAAAGSTFVPGSGARVNNAIAYTSPNWNGLKLSALYGFGEQVGAGLDRGDNGVFGVGLNYANGPLNVDLGYQARMDRVTAAGASTSQDITEWFIGGTYDFKVAKLYGSYQALENDTVAASASDFDIWNLGVSVPVGANGSVHLAYSRFEWDNNSNDANGWNIGYTHSLSKRTKLYTGYSRMNLDPGSLAVNAVGGLTAGSLSGGAAATARDNNVFYMGINHAF